MGGSSSRTAVDKSVDAAAAASNGTPAEEDLGSPDLVGMRDTHVLELVSTRAAEAEGFAKDLAELSADGFPDLDDVRDNFKRQVSDLNRAHSHRLATAQDERLNNLKEQVKEAQLTKRALDLESFQLRAILTDSEQQLHEQGHALMGEEAEMSEEIEQLYRTDFELCDRLGNTEVELHRVRAQVEFSRMLIARAGSAQMEASVERRREQDEQRQRERELSDRISAMMRELSALRQRELASTTVFVPSHFEEMEREMSQHRARAERLQSQAAGQTRELALARQHQEEALVAQKAARRRLEAMRKEGAATVEVLRLELGEARGREASLAEMVEELQDQVQEMVKAKRHGGHGDEAHADLGLQTMAVTSA